MQEDVKGRLMIIGGKEDKKGDCFILKKFVEMCGGSGASISVITTATEQPQETGEEYIGLFSKLGAGTARALNIADRNA